MEKALNFKRITRHALNDKAGRRAARRVETAIPRARADRDPLVRHLVERGGQNRAPADY